MKLANPRDDGVLISGAHARIGYKIIADAKMFGMLSSQLYERKHEAVVREVCCNAVDAHVAAGTPGRPFELHLPTADEPWLSVRDFGPGLSPADVEEVYTVYGRSTKADSNAYIGALGLGCKAPFAVADMFQVTAWHGGAVCCYAALKADGYPTLVAQHAGPSDDPSGVEVRIPATDGDRGAYREAAARLLPYFRVPPVFTSSDPPDIAPPRYRSRAEVAVEIDGAPSFVAEYGLLADRRGYSRVIMGDVSYPLVADASGLVYNRYTMTPTSPTAALVGHGVDLYVPIGTVAVTPSRESLSYDPPTIAAVRALAAAAADDLLAAAAASVADAATFWAANVAFNDAEKAHAGILGKLPPAAWRGRAVPGSVGFGVDAARVPIHAHHVGWFKSKKKRGGDDEQVWRHEQEVSQIRAERRLRAIYVDDVPAGRFAAARRHMEAAGIRRALIFPQAALADGRLVAEMGWGEMLVPLSTAPKPDRTVRAARGRSERTVLRRWYSEGGDGRGGFTNAEVDLVDGGVYVVASRDKLICQAATYLDAYPRVLRGTVHALVQLDGRDLDVYGIVPSEVHRLKKRSNWHQVDDYARRRLCEAADRHRRGAALVAAYNADWPTHHCIDGHLFAADSVYGQFQRLRGEMESLKSPALFAFIALCGQYRDAVAIEPAADLLDAQAAVLATYPLLTLASSRYGADADDVGTALSRYIRLVDDLRRADHDDAGAGGV